MLLNLGELPTVWVPLTFNGPQRLGLVSEHDKLVFNTLSLSFELIQLSVVKELSYNMYGIMGYVQVPPAPKQILYSLFV